MISINDHNLPERGEGFEIVNRIGERQITHAFHDIDGTHSLIREWQPVMSICLHFAMGSRLDDDFDNQANRIWLIENAGKKALEETDRFCEESAGLSALTQMEWAIRRGFQLGNIAIPGYRFTEKDTEINNRIIERIWKGEEKFDELNESSEIKNYIARHAPRLFKLYEDILNRVCRDKNLEDAKKNPDRWQVPGSKQFLELLHKNGVKNYFITGAVVDTNSDRVTGIHEEVVCLGYKIGRNELVEDIIGSTWNEKVTKIEAMRRLIEENKMNPEHILVVGDGRAEIQAAADMGSAAISRLDKNALRQAQIHRELGTNYITENYISKSFNNIFKTN